MDETLFSPLLIQDQISKCFTDSKLFWMIVIRLKQLQFS